MQHPRRQSLYAAAAVLLAVVLAVDAASSSTDVTPSSMCSSSSPLPNTGTRRRKQQQQQQLPSILPLPLLLLNQRGGGASNAHKKGDESLMARIEARKGSWGVRVLSTLTLLGLTAAITAVGQRKGLELVVIGAQAGAYNEVAQLLDKGLDLHSSLAGRWLWFALAVMAGHAWAYGGRMPTLLLHLPCFHWLWPRRQFLYFLLYTVLLGGSISVTGPGEMLKRQMGHLAGLHFALFLIVGLGSGYVAST